MKLFLLLICFASAVVAKPKPMVVRQHVDPHFDLPLKPFKGSLERIQEHGYPAESHFIETPDGYQLNLFRIPHSPKLNNANERKPVVLLQHGLFSSSDCYLLNGPDNALAFNFADQGFDVWLGNARGNIYSRSNMKSFPKGSDFWAFSWHEIGNIDIPTKIDYILEQTGEDKLHYVGHSQGTTVFFVMATTRPEYNDKIKSAHMLAPAIFMGNVTDGMVNALAPYVGKPGTVSRLLENQQFFPKNDLVQRILDTACGGEPTFPEYCEMLYLMWSGTNNPNMNVTLLPLVAETHPAGISTNQAIHFIQESVSNEFRQYDYGSRKNKRVYGQSEPPVYPLNLITSDMYIYYGAADGSAKAEDVERLPGYLPNIRHFQLIDDPDWAHLDFIFATQVKETINDKVIEFCKTYE